MSAVDAKHIEEWKAEAWARKTGASDPGYNVDAMFALIAEVERLTAELGTLRAGFEALERAAVERVGKDAADAAFAAKLKQEAPPDGERRVMHVRCSCGEEVALGGYEAHVTKKHSTYRGVIAPHATVLEEPPAPTRDGPRCGGELHWVAQTNEDAHRAICRTCGAYHRRTGLDVLQGNALPATCDQPEPA